METSKNTARTVEEAMGRERKFWKQNQLWTILLAAAVILLGLLRGPSLSVAPGAAELMLTMHDGSTQTLEYSTIQSLQLLEDGNYGTPLEGTENRTGRSGTWNHPQWGNYTICAYASCSQAVRITTESHCYVVNLPSESETQQLYQLLQDKMPASK